MALSAVWYLEKWNDIVDLPTYFQPQCGTFLVPKPIMINLPDAAFTAFNSLVWLLFFSSFLASTILLTTTARAQEKIYTERISYTNFSRATIEIINTATNHSVDKFHRQHLSLKVILLSWILLSFWIGISYTTIYTSRLTMPQYSKPINSVPDFLSQGLRLCAPYVKDNYNYGTLLTSTSEEYRKLAEEVILYGDDTELQTKLFEGRKCGLFALTVGDKFVLKYSSELAEDLTPYFRLMRSCYMNRFTTFAFQKHSPYRKVFDWHIRRYQENGIITKWLLDIAGTQDWEKHLFENYPDISRHPQKIELYHINGAFIILFGGLFFSTVLFAAEVVKHRNFFIK